MTSGKILFAENDGTYILKLAGEVRFNLCGSLETFLEKMCEEPDFRSVIVDLIDAETIDSTSLGLLAKLSIHVKKRFGLRPVILSTRKDINRILESMSLDTVFRIMSNLKGLEKIKLNFADVCGDELADQSASVRRVLDAHKVLMSLNEENEKAFSDLVSQLEQIKEQEEHAPA